MVNARDTSGRRILIVCTGNVCRSPYIERRLAAELFGAELVVRSAGTGALVGSDLDPEVALRLRARGSDAGDFRARQVDAELIRTADLVLCATRMHRSEVVRLEPRGLRRTFTVAEFADLATAALDQRSDGHDLAERTEAPVRLAVRRAAAARADATLRDPEDDDIPDPYRKPPAHFDAMAERVEMLLPPVVRLLRNAAAEAAEAG